VTRPALTAGALGPSIVSLNLNKSSSSSSSSSFLLFLLLLLHENAAGGSSGRHLGASEATLLQDGSLYSTEASGRKAPLVERS